MRVLVLNGSPKGDKSNTYRLTSAFLDGLRQTQPVEAETIEVGKLHLLPCRGCFACWSKTPGKCVLQDDMAGVIEKILAADVLIWSFPLYYFSIPGQLKLLIDRQLPVSLPFMTDTDSGGHPSRYDRSGQRQVVISTCGFYTAEGNYDAVDAQVSRLCGKDGYTSVYCGQGELFRVPALHQRTDAYLELVKQAGAEFARGAILPETARALRQPLFPRAVFEQMADASWGVSREDTAAAKTPEAGRLSPAQAFTRQMAALYDPSTWDGRDRVLEFFYTDTGETCQIVLGKDGQRVLQSNFLPCTTRIETPLSVWQKIGSGELDGKQAMMEHQYRVTGDFSVMLHWDEIFGLGAAAPQPSAEPRKKTNMTLMLLPWMAIWIALSIHAQIGACIGLAVCALLPFAFLNYRMTVFEPCSILAVGTICVLTLLDALPLTLLLPASYLLFGLMWGVTVFLPMPLTAYYSMNGYGGETALQNPLFMHTNRILTACWAVLYLLTPVWTWYLLQTPVSYLTGAVNSALPMLLGAFTAWFQRWYPAHYAASKK